MKVSHKAIFLFYFSPVHFWWTSRGKSVSSAPSAILRAISTQTGSPELSTSDINGHKWLFSGTGSATWDDCQLCTEQEGVCVFGCVSERAGSGRGHLSHLIHWNLSPSITCWNLLRQAKDRPRLSHSQGVNQSDSRRQFGWNNVEIDPLPAKWQNAEPNGLSEKRKKRIIIMKSKTRVALLWIARCHVSQIHWNYVTYPSG